MKMLSMSVVALLALASSSMSASGQSTSTAPAASSTDATSAPRQGFFIGGGLGLGSVRFDCDCNTRNGYGVFGQLHLGGTISPNLRLGVAAERWAGVYGRVHESIGFWSGAAYVYPRRSSNVWIKGAIGLITLRSSLDVDHSNADGAGVSVGVGYDWAVRGGNFVIVPFGGYTRQLSGHAWINGSDTGVSLNTTILEAGMNLGFRH